VKFGAAFAALYFAYSVITDLAIWGAALYYFFEGF